MIIVLKRTVQFASIRDLIGGEAEGAHTLATLGQQHSRQKSTAHEIADAEKGGQKSVPGRSPAFACCISRIAVGCERGRTPANQWESLGSPRKTCREVLVDRPKQAEKPITTAFKPTLADLISCRAEKRRKQEIRKAHP